MRALGTVPLFAGVEERVLRLIALTSEDRTLPAGSTVVCAGEQGDELFVVLEGAARAEVRGREVRRFGPGDVFGELAVLDGRPRAADVVAESDLRCVVVPRGRLRKVLISHPNTAWALLETLATRLRDDRRGETP